MRGKSKLARILTNWKDIPSYEGYYQVSDDGQVRSVGIKTWNGKTYYIKQGRTLKQSIAKSGYSVVNLCKDAKQVVRTVHTLVAHAFIGYDQTVNHKDGNKQNNNVSNLESISYRANNIHALEAGLRKRKIQRENVPEIKDLINKGWSKTEVAARYAVDTKTIDNVLNNRLLVCQDLNNQT